jgi:hypothetical protein
MSFGLDLGYIELMGLHCSPPYNLTNSDGFRSLSLNTMEHGLHLEELPLTLDELKIASRDELLVHQQNEVLLVQLSVFKRRQNSFVCGCGCAVR